MDRRITENLAAEERLLLALADDKAALALQRQQPCYTNFLDPGQRVLLQRYAYRWEATLASWGGYEGAERQIVAFLPPFLDYEPEYPLVALEARGNFSFATVTHRDFLGSLLALGIKREMVGDILVGASGCQLLVTPTIASCVLTNWQVVGRVGITVAPIPLSEIIPPTPQEVCHSATVASLRLDAVVAAAYSISRTQAAELIRAGRLKHNFLLETRCDKMVAAGDVLSLAGKGRAYLRQVGGQTKRGRWHVLIARPL